LVSSEIVCVVCALEIIVNNSNSAGNIFLKKFTL
jgi:hypothetical protein